MMNQRLLLVEDEEHLAFTLEFNLTQEGYDVDTAGTVQEAASRIKAPYDLILLDVMLPDGDGFDFCKNLRTEGNLTPVLFLTAKGTPDDIVAGLESGADDYITKPFVLKELLARISAMLRRKQWETDADSDLPANYQFGKNIIHLNNHMAEVKGKPVSLTALEFRLLLYFIENEDQVLTRESLLEQVWEVSANNTTRTVDNFLVRLRRLFEADPSKPRHFLTVRGVGYRFVQKG